MYDFTPLIFMAVFGGAIALDLFGHYKRRLYRKTFDKVFLFILFVLLGFSTVTFFAVRQAVSIGDEPGRYVAFQYLLENDPDSAMYIVSEDGDMSEESRKLISIMAEAESGDYQNLYFDACEFLDKKGYDASQMVAVEELKQIAEMALDSEPVSDSGILSIVKNSYAAMDIKETEELKKLYQTDKSIRSGNADSVAESDVTALLDCFQKHDIVEKIGISYYLTREDYETAASMSQDLIEKRETEANYVLYTDVMAQAAYAEETDNLAQTTDEEIQPLVEKAISHYETAASANGNDISTIETNAEEAEAYYTQARGVYYQRLINFLVLKKNQGFDKDGIISLQLIKLSILKEDYDLAINSMNSLLDRIESLETSSPIREDLLKIREVQIRIEEGGLGSESSEFLELCADVSNLLNDASCMIFTYGDDNINDRVYKVMASMIYSSTPVLKITASDTSKYPKTAIDFSLNVRKKNIIGGPGEYYADDFTFTDQGEVVNDCKLTAMNGYSGRSAVFVLDLQNGEIAEKDLEELKHAMYNFTNDDRIADQYALVNSTSYIVSELTTDDNKVRYAMRNVNTQYDVSASTCLNTAMDLLENRSDEEDRVIFYITNGSSLTEDELLSTVNRANGIGVRIYSITIGTGEDGYADSMCTATGGISLHVPYYDQLCVFTGHIAELMNYRYSAEFTASTVPDQLSGRQFEILLNELGISDTVVYSGGES